MPLENRKPYNAIVLEGKGLGDGEYNTKNPSLNLENTFDTPEQKSEASEGSVTKAETASENPIESERMGDRVSQMEAKGEEKVKSFTEKIGGAMGYAIEKAGVFASLIENSRDWISNKFNKGKERQFTRMFGEKPPAEAMQENVMDSNDSVVEANAAVDKIGHNPTIEAIADGRNSIKQGLDKTMKLAIENPTILEKFILAIVDALGGKNRNAAIEANKKKLNDPNPEVAANAQKIDAEVAPKMDVMAKIKELEARVQGLEGEKIIEQPVAENPEVANDAAKTGEDELKEAA